MKTRVIQNPILPSRGFAAITLFGFVFTRDKRKVDARTLNHERIHCRQQLEWLYLPFFIAYGIEWLYYLVKFRSGLKAYYSISFEREAYQHDHDFTYLDHRPLFANYRSGKRRKR